MKKSSFASMAALLMSRPLRSALSALMFTLGCLLAESGTAHAFAVYGAIGDKYNALGGPGGVLGQPLSDEADSPYGGRFNNFQHGSIYWHPTIGAFAVWGAIHAKWSEHGRVAYGYPITDELPTPDGRGRFNHFRAIHMQGAPEASIYWTPHTGAHVIYGAIRAKWASMGWERSPVGYPTSDEYQDGGYRRSDFENGYIRWSPQGGAEVVEYGAGVSSPGPFGDIAINGMGISVKGRVLAADNKFLSEPALCGLWKANLDTLNQQLKDFVRSNVNPRMGGFSIRSDARMSLTQACSAKASVLRACDEQVIVKVALPRNLFKFHVTTPTVFGGWADPEFSVDWDMEARINIRIPNTASTPFGISDTNLTISGIKLDSQNVTGDLAKAVYSVYTYFGGQDILAELKQDRTLGFGGIQQTILQLHPALGQIPNNYHIEACVKDKVLMLDGTDVVYQGPYLR